MKVAITKEVDLGNEINGVSLASPYWGMSDYGKDYMTTFDLIQKVKTIAIDNAMTDEANEIDKLLKYSSTSLEFYYKLLGVAKVMGSKLNGKTQAYECELVKQLINNIETMIQN